MTATLDDTARRSWQDWRAQRLVAVTAPHGVAALTTTTWLGEDPATVPGLPGTWYASGDVVRGLDDDEVVVPVGGSAPFGDVELRAILRGGHVGLRVFDPAAPTRTSLRDIDAFDHRPEWVVTGSFTPAVAGTGLEVEHVDGATTEDPLAGTVRVRIGGHEADLVAFPSAARPGGLQIVFADATNGTRTQQFRFLETAPPAADGSVDLDFNRAHLPPCAFSDHYLCPLPPTANRLPVPVDAGETRPTRG
ncbi:MULTISPECIES: DUF1684 domain-containing protein [unclassified Aeromicrobium]|uniref:DUF1684 domain-containing protein n=1 Tax=unclassified Aeromicrobium TaxID=2633570 RepID=UPI00396B2B8B